MQITCPGCGFSRDVPQEKLPLNSTLATCPKCAKKFKFRDLPVFMPYDREAPGTAVSQPEDRPEATPRAQPAAFAQAPLLEPEPPRPAPPAAAPIPEQAPEPAPIAPPVTDAALPAGEDTPQPPRPKPVRKLTLDDEFGPIPPVQSYTPPPQPQPEADLPPTPQTPGTASGESPGEPGEETPQQPRPRPNQTFQFKEMGDFWSKLRQESEEQPGGGPDEEDPEENGYDGPGERTIPWENQRVYGFFTAYFLTLKMIVRSPIAFFGTLGREGGGKGNALVFALIIMELIFLISFLWFLASPAAKLGPEYQELVQLTGGNTGSVLLKAFIIFPLFMGFLSYLDAAMSLVLLRVLRAKDADFSSVHRLICYSAAPGLVMAVPLPAILLLPVLLIWNIFLQSVGARELYRIPLVHALAVALIKWTVYLALIIFAAQTMLPR